VFVQCTDRMEKMTDILAKRILLGLLNTPEMREEIEDYAFGRDSSHALRYLLNRHPAQFILEQINADDIATYAANHCRSELIQHYKDNASWCDSVIETTLEALLP
jgi:hypothetical protein